MALDVYLPQVIVLHDVLNMSLRLYGTNIYLVIHIGLTTYQIKSMPEASSWFEVSTYVSVKFMLRRLQ